MSRRAFLTDFLDNEFPAQNFRRARYRWYDLEDKNVTEYPTQKLLVLSFPSPCIFPASFTCTPPHSSFQMMWVPWVVGRPSSSYLYGMLNNQTNIFCTEHLTPVLFHGRFLHMFAYASATLHYSWRAALSGIWYI